MVTARVPAGVPNSATASPLCFGLPPTARGNPNKDFDKMPALAAGIFHFDAYSIPAVKRHLARRGVPIRITHPEPAP
jgi:hypothetical protein